jgi:PHS family inorganic phosphate transporter-like MFS transporter
MGISMLWFLLDVAFYGTGLDSPGTLHRLWLDHKPAISEICHNTTAVVHSATTHTLTLDGGIATIITGFLATSTGTLTATTTTAMTTVTATVTKAPAWNVDDGDKCATISTALSSIAERTLLLSSIASCVGSIAAVYMVNRFSRRTLMASTSGALCLLFLASGFAVWQTTERPANEVGMVFFALTQFMFNMGPNTLTFIVAAESFPTVFRGTFYGIAAAAGKLGALVIRPVIYTIGKDKDDLMNVLFGFSGVMLLMVVVSLLPGAMLEAQHPRKSLPDNSIGTLSRAERGWKAWLPLRLRNKTLEEIAPNPESLLKKLLEDGNGVHQVRDLEDRRAAVGYAMAENRGTQGPGPVWRSDEIFRG